MLDTELETISIKENDLKDFLKEIPENDKAYKKETKENKIKELLDTIEPTITTKKEDTKKIADALIKLNELIQLIGDNKIDSLKGLKEFVLVIDTLVDLRELNSEELINELNVDKEKILKSLEYNSHDKEINKYLKSILDKVQSYYLKNKINPIIENEDKDPPFEEFDIQVLDELYQKLYDAMNNNDIKKVTYYRGKIIKKLKKNKKKIENKYNEIKNLHAIKQIIEKNDNSSMEDIRKILLKDEKYKNYFASYMDNYSKFKKNFEIFMEKSNINKIILYKEALNIELLMQNKDLKSRYEKEFLEQKGNLSNTVTVLPTAVALSIQKLANTITELKESKTNRKKIVKATEAIGDSLRVLGTPVIYMGKFLLNNWYALYTLYKNGVKISKNNEGVKSEDILTQVGEKQEVDKTILKDKLIANKTSINNGLKNKIENLTKTIENQETQESQETNLLSKYDVEKSLKSDLTSNHDKKMYSVPQPQPELLPESQIDDETISALSDYNNFDIDTNLRKTISIPVGSQGTVTGNGGMFYDWVEIDITDFYNWCIDIWNGVKDFSSVQSKSADILSQPTIKK